MSEQIEVSRWQPITDWLKRHPSIVIGALLMLASSGLDGAYMTLLMPREVAVFRWTWSFAWLGLVLNLAADGTDLYLSARIGRLMRSKDAVKQWGGLVLLAVGLLVVAGYSWYFSYLQLRRVLPAIESQNADLVARWLAGFIPALIVILGLEDGLSNFSSQRYLGDRDTEQGRGEPVALSCPICGATHGKSGRPFLTQAAVSGHMSEHRHEGNGHSETMPAEEQDIAS